MSTVITALASYLFFRKLELLDAYFFIPVFILATIFAAGNLYKQWRGESDFTVSWPDDISQLLKRSAVRYAVWLSVFTIGYTFILQHPYYSSPRFVHSIDFLSFYYKLYLVGGLPYFIITLTVKSSRIEDFYDPAVRIIHIIKSIGIRIFTKTRPTFTVMRHAYNKKVILNLLMRAYFMPTMIVQVHNMLSVALDASKNEFSNHNILSILLFITALLWLMDATIASMSYSIESRWLENRSRSLDLTAGGWLICFSCYAPLNQTTSILFPFAPAIADQNTSSMLFDSSTIHYLFLVTENILLALLVYADASLGPSIANISLKKLQTRGLFGIIRHPVYTCKILMWWVIAIGYRKFWSFKYIFGQFSWTLIYILRALSEERHLKKFAPYRDYMKRVRYRFIPWLY